jgi:cysteine desulfurase
LLHLKKKHEFLDLEWVVVDEDGGIDYDHLATLLANTESKTLVSLMTVNNEIGNMLDLEKVSKLCKDYHAYFHTDAVQAVGHFNIDVEKTPIDFLVASSHKFHGPRGVGFVYIKKGIPVDPILFGGSQEKGVRPGTENVAGIIGMEKALEISMNSLEDHAFKVLELKKHLIGELNVLGDFKFNGKSGSLEESSYTILSVRFPVENSLLLFELDLKGIAASGGSACQSGSTKGSHVLGEILSPEEASKTSIRFSLSKLNTKDEIDHLVKIIAQVLKK